RRPNRRDIRGQDLRGGPGGRRARAAVSSLYRSPALRRSATDAAHTRARAHSIAWRPHLRASRGDLLPVSPALSAQDWNDLRNRHAAGDRALRATPDCLPPAAGGAGANRPGSFTYARIMTMGPPLTSAPKHGHKSLLFSDVVTDLDSLKADIAVLGIPYGDP